MSDRMRASRNAACRLPLRARSGRSPKSVSLSELARSGSASLQCDASDLARAFARDSRPARPLPVPSAFRN
jgi:hypothetical protein